MKVRRRRGIAITFGEGRSEFELCAMARLSDQSSRERLEMLVPFDVSVMSTTDGAGYVAEQELLW